jgi:hypothetical protein
MSRLNLTLYAVMTPGSAAKFKACLFGDRLFTRLFLRNALRVRRPSTGG